MDFYHEKTKYFGVSELLETTRSGSGLPLLRYDSSFESMAAALEERYVSVLFLILQLLINVHFIHLRYRVSKI